MPLGALIYYKPPKHVDKPSFEARTVPGLFVGWRLDSGYKHKKMDYESVRLNAKGCGRPIQVYASKIVVPDSFVFPLFNAAKKSWKEAPVSCKRLPCHLRKVSQILWSASVERM